MDMSAIANYFAPIIIIACLVVGYVVKNLVPNEKINKFIPLIVAVLGAVLNVWYTGWIVDLPTILTGAISGLASTGLYEAFANFLKNGNVSPEVEGE